VPGEGVNQSCQTPRISIITVVRNAAVDLTRTMASVRLGTYSNLEYLIIDGGSTDGTLDVLRANADLVHLWVSEPDRGIYDAMNKGIVRATGDYLLFLNAGDELAIDLRELVPFLVQGFAMVYGKANMIRQDGTLSYVKGKPLKSLNKLVRGTPLCHQAILYRRDVMGVYDTSYRILADRVLTFELVKREGLSRTKFVDLVIANYYEGGFSRQNEAAWRREEILFLHSLGWTLYAWYRHLTLVLKRFRGKLP
jgi:glycosyltransferase involved in cell wall biosynthesis